MNRANSLEKTLLLGKTEGRRRGWQRKRWLDCITDSMDMSLSNLWEKVKDRRPGVLQSMGCKELDTTKQLNWTELNMHKNLKTVHGSIHNLDNMNMQYYIITL